MKTWTRKLVQLIDTKSPETKGLYTSVVTKRRVVWWIITDSAKEAIAVIRMCHVAQQQRQKEMGFFPKRLSPHRRHGSSIRYNAVGHRGSHYPKKMAVRTAHRHKLMSYQCHSCSDD